MKFRILKPGFFTYYVQNVETEKIEASFRDLSELQRHADEKGWEQIEEFNGC